MVRSAKRLYICPIFLVLLLGTSAFIKNDENQNYIKLGHIELINIITGSKLSYIGTQNMIGGKRPNEYFYNSGLYMISIHNGPIEGRWYVLKEKICVKFIHIKPVCREVYRNKNGKYFISYPNIDSPIGYKRDGIHQVNISNEVLP